MTFDAWIKVPLGDVVSLQRGHDLPNQERKYGLVPVMGSSGVTGFHNIARADGPGVVIGRSGNSMGVVSYSECDYWPLNTVLYVTDFKGNDQRFIYYLLKTVDFDQFNSGSAQKSLNRNAVYPFEIFLPENIEYQKRIANILSSLENKISINNKINQTLEDMAHALFKSWFVDFEPVKAKAIALQDGGNEEDATLAAMQVISGNKLEELEGIQKYQPKRYAELKATAALFPSAMQDSVLGEVPEGWNTGTLRDVAELASERIPTSDVSVETYVSTENMLENRKGITSATSVPNTKKVHAFREGQTLVSNIRPYFKKIWLARFDGGRSADVLAFASLIPTDAEYLYNLLYQDSFFEYMMRTSKGVKMPRGDKDAIMNLDLVIPPVGLRRAYSESVTSYFKYSESLVDENRRLSELRDTLLPKLLSGELTLPKADIELKEAENV